MSFLWQNHQSEFYLNATFVGALALCSIAMMFRYICIRICDPKMSFSLSNSRIHYDDAKKMFTARVRLEVQNNGILPAVVRFDQSNEMFDTTLFQIANKILSTQKSGLNFWMRGKGIYCGGEEESAPKTIGNRHNLMYFETQFYFKLDDTDLVNHFADFLKEIYAQAGSTMVAYYEHPWTGEMIKFTQQVDWLETAEQLKDDLKIMKKFY